MTGLDVLDRLLRPLPDASGGTALVLATAARPPAVAMLSTGSVVLGGNLMRIAVLASSSVVARLGGGATLVAPWEGSTLRAEMTSASVRLAGELAVIEGAVVAVRPSVELPWQLQMNFVPSPAPRTGERDPTASDYLAYWRTVRAWLEDAALGDAPHAPAKHRPADQPSAARAAGTSSPSGAPATSTGG